MPISSPTPSSTNQTPSHGRPRLTLTTRMRFSHRLNLGLISTTCAILLATTGQSLPQDIDPADTAHRDAITRISGNEESTEDWITALQGLDQQDTRSQIQQTLQQRETFPREDLVHCLDHPQLRVRLGALEFLEDAAGTDHGFNPWLSPGHEDNIQPLEDWLAWARDDTPITRSHTALSHERLPTYFQAIMGDDNDARERAMRMLQPHAMEAVGEIATFLNENPNLHADAEHRMRAAQYQLVIVTRKPLQAPNIASNLVFGNRDQLLGALTEQKEIGLVAIPILLDFLSHDDPLVRETSIDVLLTIDTHTTFPLVIDHLRTEQDTNVLQIAARRLDTFSTEESADFLLGLVEHDHEDVVVTALESLTHHSDDRSFNRFSGDYEEAVREAARNSIFSRRNTEDEEEDVEEEPEEPQRPDRNKIITNALNDPRWRVRAATLQLITKQRETDTADAVLELLHDEDAFVRFQAMEAAAALKIKGATAIIEEILAEEPEIAGVALKALADMGSLKPSHVDIIAEMEPLHLADALHALTQISAAQPSFTRRFLTHENEDIAFTALRHTASSGWKDPESRAFMISVLNGNDSARKEALLSSLRIPHHDVLQNLLARGAIEINRPSHLQIPADPTQPNEEINALIDAFTHAHDAAEDAADAADDKGDGVLKSEMDLIHTLESLITADDEFAFRSALLLLPLGLPTAVNYLADGLDQRPVSERSAIIRSISSNTPATIAPLIQTLLNDPADTIREETLRTVTYFRDSPEILELALKSIDSGDSPITPWAFYSSSLESSASNTNISPAIANWAKTTINDPTSSDEKTILALTLFRHSASAADLNRLTELSSHESQWIRRAALHCIGSMSPASLQPLLDDLLNDPSAQVRMVLPEIVSRADSVWSVMFNDSRHVSVYQYTPERSQRTLLPAFIPALETLAGLDPSPDVRFEAMFGLLTHRQAINIHEFVSQIPLVQNPDIARNRLGRFISDNYQSLGQSFAPLIAHIPPETLSRRREEIHRHFNISETLQFSSFEELVSTDATGETDFIGSDDDSGPSVADSSSEFEVIYFAQPGCRDCERAENMINHVLASFPSITLRKLSIVDSEGAILNQALCNRYNVPTPSHGVAPAIFLPAGFLIHPDVNEVDFRRLVDQSAGMDFNPEWTTFNPTELSTASAGLEERFESLSLFIVITAGLLDGVNPCAFATIIFFLSYLHVARRSPREILAVGFAFISAIFITYFATGLFLYTIIEAVESKIQFARYILNSFFAIFAFTVAWFSFRDGLKARRGQMEDMTLQLPGFLKKGMRSVIRKGARASHFVIAAFLAGIAIAFIELACTGQVYLPIIFKIQQGSGSAVAYLLLFNAAFILPLIVVFGLAYGGMRSDTLIRFQEKNAATVKFATAGLFLLLALLLISTII